MDREVHCGVVSRTVSCEVASGFERWEVRRSVSSMSSVGSSGDSGVGWTLDDFDGLAVEGLSSRFCSDVRMREDCADFIRTTFNSYDNGVSIRDCSERKIGRRAA